MVLRNAFENLSVESKQDEAIIILNALLTELGQKLETGQAIALDAATLTSLENITAVVSGTVSVSNLPGGRQKTHVEFIPSSAAPITIYKGYAPVGTLDSAAEWTIQRFVFTGTTLIDETWTAVGTASWTNRAAEVYS